MLFCESLTDLARAARLSELCQVSVQVSLQFIVEHHPQGPAPGLRNARGFALIDAIERGVVLGFAWLDEAVVDCLALRQSARFQDEALSFFRQNEETFGSASFVIQCLLHNKPLLRESANLTIHSIGIAGIAELTSLLENQRSAWV